MLLSQASWVIVAKGEARRVGKAGRAGAARHLGMPFRKEMMHTGFFYTFLHYYMDYTRCVNTCQSSLNKCLRLSHMAMAGARQWSFFFAPARAKVARKPSPQEKGG